MRIQYLPLFCIVPWHDCNNDDDDNYLTLGSYYILGSVLMALHAILFSEIPDTSGFDFWQLGIGENFVFILHRMCLATK